MNHYFVECCSNSVKSAIQGELGGANRVELCANLEVGGITPSREDIQKSKKLLNIPLSILIRPKAGNFLYTGEEILQMIDDILFCKKVGCDGVVLGILRKNGSINKEQCKQLVNIAKPMHVTFHRAFDEGNDLAKNLEDIISCGCKTLLTSGQAKNVNLGFGNLERLIKVSSGRINIIAGSGVNHTNVDALFKIGVRNFHLSGSEKNIHGVLETNSQNIQAVVEKLESLV